MALSSLTTGFSRIKFTFKDQPPFIDFEAAGADGGGNPAGAFHLHDIGLDKGGEAAADPSEVPFALGVHQPFLGVTKVP